MENLFDLVLGLPVHPLIDHFVVVLVPMFSILQILNVLKPKLKEKYGWITVGGLAVALGATGIASSSGESLALRVGYPGDHAQQGEALVGVVSALFIGSAVWMIFTEKYEFPIKSLVKYLPLLGKATILAAIAALITTIVVGHSGAKAVWDKKLASTKSVTKTALGKTLTANEVAKHSSKKDCWSVVNGNVYDLTAFVGRHPGGAGNIELMCGKDASSAFGNQHGSGGRPNNELSNYLLGKMDGSGGANLAPAPAGNGEEGEGEEE